MDDTTDLTVLTGADGAGDQARLDPPRVVRLDSLTPPERELVLALIEAARAAKEATETTARRSSASAPR